MTTTHSVSRREANKARTREGLVLALRSLVSTEGIDAITVEAIAEHAGVSRRTFFNYFPSIEAALAEGTSAPLDVLAQAFLGRPADEDPVTAIRAALAAVPLSEQLLAWVHAVKCSSSEEHPLTINVWQYHREWLEGIIAQRIGHDPLRVGTLAGTVMELFGAVERLWMEQTTVVDKSAVEEFNVLLDRALQHARAGWVA